MSDRLLILKDGELKGSYMRSPELNANMLVDAMI
jgi:hypothetical protein